MKKFIILSISFILTSAASIADSYMPVPDAVNSRMFSTEGTKPLLNLERTHYTNRAIMEIEAKNKPQKETSAEVIKENSEQQLKQKTRFKDLFKGFVCEW